MTVPAGDLRPIACSRSDSVAAAPRSAKPRVQGVPDAIGSSRGL
jgi:hypothetical protein